MLPDERIFIDTNVFLRAFDDEDNPMAQDCRAFIRAIAAGEVECWTTHLVLAEVAWTLRTYYAAPRERIAAAVRSILDLRSLQLERREMLREAVESYASLNVDWIDAYNAAEVKRRGQTSVCSYDRHFERLGLLRLEPPGLQRG
jgi:predicted nucleic-acid-binding protein